MTKNRQFPASMRPSDAFAPPPPSFSSAAEHATSAAQLANATAMPPSRRPLGGSQPRLTAMRLVNTGMLGCQTEPTTALESLSPTIMHPWFK